MCYVDYHLYFSGCKSDNKVQAHIFHIRSYSYIYSVCIVSSVHACCHGMEWCLLEDCSTKWTRLLTTLSLPRGVQLAEKLVQTTDVNDSKNIFHWPCFLKQLTSCSIVTTKDHDVLE